MKRLSLPAGYFRDERHYSFKVTTSGRRLPNFKRLSLPARVSYATLLFWLAGLQGVGLQVSSTGLTGFFKVLYTRSRDSGIVVPSKHWFYLTAQGNHSLFFPLPGPVGRPPSSMITNHPVLYINIQQ